eukprot:SAG22_NODE_119_length_19257_cov_43.260413_20_plen_155_part_00
MSAGGGPWQQQWAGILGTITASSSKIRLASKFAVDNANDAAEVLTVRSSASLVSFLGSRAQMYSPRGRAAAPIVLGLQNLAWPGAEFGAVLGWRVFVQMLLKRLEQLDPRERIPIIYLLDAIVQVSCGTIPPHLFPFCSPRASSSEGFRATRSY